MTTPTTAILTGSGAHTDPWHALDDTSAAVAAVLGTGAARRVSTDAVEPGALEGVDVVVVNASGDPGRAPADSSVVVDELLRHLGAGGGIVALHSSTIAFADGHRWARAIGGRWVPGVSGHPPIGHALVQAAGTPLLDRDFSLHDERYTGLEVAEDVEVVAFHTEDGRTHPLVWVREGPGRVAYSALGHGVESYASPNAELLRALVAWAAPSR